MVLASDSPALKSTRLSLLEQPTLNFSIKVFGINLGLFVPLVRARTVAQLNEILLFPAALELFNFEPKEREVSRRIVGICIVESQQIGMENTEGPATIIYSESFFVCAFCHCISCATASLVQQKLVLQAPLVRTCDPERGLGLHPGVVGTLLVRPSPAFLDFPPLFIPRWPFVLCRRAGCFSRL